MTGQGEQPWARCWCDDAYWKQQPDGTYKRVEGEPPS
jgi:hypothetical protein